MQRFTPGLAVHGLIGGLIAGAVVAAWFFVADIAAGHSFETPARLASIILRTEFTGPWPRMVLAYSVMHFAVFAILGLTAAWVLAVLELEPGLLVGAFFGIGVLNAVHYLGVLATGENLLTVVPVAQVTMANLAGGVAMMAYLHRILRIKSPLGWIRLRTLPLVYEGLSTGFVGAAAVAFWFLMVDLAGGGPFNTPAALGSALLLGATEPAETVVSFGIIATYTFVHLAVFVLLGLAFAWVVRSSSPTSLWPRAIAMLALLEVLFFGTLGFLSPWVIERLGWLVILVANVLAVTSMGLWLLRIRGHAKASGSEQAATSRA